MQQALAGVRLHALGRTDRLACLRHAHNLVGIVPAGAQHAGHALFQRRDELLGGIEHRLQVVFAGVLHMKARRAGAGHLELGGERGADVVRGNLVSMAGNRKDAHRGGAPFLGTRDGLRRGAQVRVLGRAGVDDDAARRDREHRLQGELTLADGYGCGVGTHGQSPLHALVHGSQLLAIYQLYIQDFPGRRRILACEHAGRA